MMPFFANVVIKGDANVKSKSVYPIEFHAKSSASTKTIFGLVESESPKSKRRDDGDSTGGGGGS